ncbi:hypothetical protein NEF87_003740 [Candidatus Lokiarchaeum ossiferum]|uniref:4Fe-4S ferredoxin-type domain-containing protein n=1 Tax=Candidatus Lokiarchaeum ossiferum TaxID=2951803 RepID=A0ABY6HVA2_9ARCH|nr:hypothetical protein NEF87_003740 [Candidatus Lokiarchaeum sp. B-35]
MQTEIKVKSKTNLGLRQKIRKSILFLWLVVMPITFNLFSPILIIMAGFEATINMSIIIFAIWFLSSLIFGRAYCAYGCQWGALQEIFGETMKKKLDPNKKTRNRKVKFPVFIIWIVVVFLGPILAGGYFNGINFFYPNVAEQNQWWSFDGRAPSSLIFYFGIQISVILIFVLIPGNRGLCAYGCPMGVLGILGTKIKNFFKWPSLHLESDSSKCIKCKKCSKECPMSIDVHTLIQSENIEDMECILCGSCVDVCSHDVIKFAWKWKK